MKNSNKPYKIVYKITLNIHIRNIIKQSHDMNKSD